MAGFAAMLGGAGQAAGNILNQRNVQMRDILERQRENFGNQLIQQAASEGHNEHRDSLLKIGTDLLSGKPLNKIIPAYSSLLQSIQADHQAANALAQSLLPQGQQATPGPRVGQAPGTGGGEIQPPAAQAPNSPVSPQEQAGKIGQDYMGMLLPQQTQAPQQAPSVTVTPQQQVQAQGQFDPRAMRSAIISDYNNRMMQATPAMRPILERQMQGELANLLPFEQQALREANLTRLESTPQFKGLSPFMQIGPIEEAYGFQPSGMAGFGSMMIPRVLSTSTPGEQAPTGQRDVTGNPVKAGTRYRIEVVPMTGEQLWTPETPQNVVVQTAGGVGVADRNNPLAGVTAFPGAVPPSANQYRTAPTAQGGVEVYTPAQVSTGMPTSVPNAVTPGLVPRQSSSSLEQTPYGSKSTRTVAPILPGSPSPSGAGSVSGPSNLSGPSLGPVPPSTPTPSTGAQGAPVIKRVLPAQQSTKYNQQLNVYDRVINRMQYVRDHMDVLDNMLDAGRIELATQPGTGALIVSRMLPLNDNEAKFAADFQSLAEDINLLRGPLGATGFRGPEAFQALQGLKGHLMAQPKLSKAILENTIGDAISQRDPIADTLGKGHYAQAQQVPVIREGDKASYDKLPRGSHYKVGDKEYIKR